MHFDVRVNDVLYNDEVFVFTYFSNNPDDLIKHDFVCQWKDICVVFQHHECRLAGIIFDFNKTMTVMCCFNVFHNTDQLDFGHCFFNSIDGDEL